MGEDGPKTISCKVKYDDGDSCGVLTSELVLDRAPPVAEMDTTVVSRLRKVTVVDAFEDSTVAGPWSFTVVDPPGSCCAANGTCTVTLQAACTGTSTRTMFGVCNPNPCTQGMVLVFVGLSTMGSPTGELGRDSGETQHQVTLTKSFYMSDHEVTPKEWYDVMGTRPSRFTVDNLPVERVSWYACIDYCKARSTREGLEPVYTRSGTGVNWDQSKTGYRLPTEAEWEYACRAGSTTAFCNGPITNTDCSDANLDQVGWYCGNAGSTTHAVKGKSPNGVGLYDMHGNVLEWCWDRYGAYTGNPTDPTGPASGSYSIIRGGSWIYNALRCRSADRYDNYPGYMS